MFVDQRKNVAWKMPAMWNWCFFGVAPWSLVMKGVGWVGMYKKCFGGYMAHLYSIEGYFP